MAVAGIEGHGVRVVRAGVERVDELEPLWLSMHEHHLTVGSPIALREPRDTWPLRRAEYVTWLAELDAFAMIAEEGGRAIGYALVNYRELDDVRVTGPRFAVLQSLAVLPEARGRGVGTALMHAVYGELRRLGIGELEIGVMFANERARRFYEREGFVPWSVEYFGPVPER
jgi:GNAT superfamily N-acetyltransferase